MEELQLTLTPVRVDQRNFGVMLSNWRVGQVINALVVDRMPSGNVLLNAGGREFVTPLDLPVQSGNRLQLEVQQVTPQLILKLLTQTEKSGVSQTSELAVKSGPTASNGPPGSLTVMKSPVATLLSSLASQPGLKAALSQNPVLASALTALSSQVLQPSGLSGGALAQAVAQSGLFNEANLLSGRIRSYQESAKTQLATIERTLSALGSANPQSAARLGQSNFSDLTNAALANLNQQQLISLPQENAGQRWAFHLPLEWAGSFTDLAMTIERDVPPEDSPESRPSWQVNLDIDLPETGRLNALLTLVGSELSVLFRSDSAEVRSIFEASLGDLKQRMVVSDFRVKDLSTGLFSAPIKQAPQSFERLDVTA